MELNHKLKTILDECNIQDENGNVRPENFQSFLIKLNDEYNAQEEQIEKLEVILDTNPCTISWVTKDIEYVGVNKTLADMCNLPKEDFPQKTVGYYTENKYFYDFTKSLFDSKDSTHYEELKSHINGELKRFWVVGTKFDKGNQAIIIGMDITELKSMESTINLMEKLSSLGEMVASIIHEVNNPLAMINLQSMQIKKYVEKGKYEHIAEMAEKIEQTTMRISKLIVGIKSFVRRGDDDPKHLVEIEQVIKDAYTICEGKFKENGVTFKFDENQKKHDLTCNVTHIFQVFVNLFTNSIDAIQAEDEKWVNVHIEENEAELKIEVSDSGKGIPSEVASKIFDNFYTTKEVGKGTGIGLALSQKIMNSHNGSITLNQEAKNTTFVLKFNKLKE